MLLLNQQIFFLAVDLNENKNNNKRKMAKSGSAARKRHRNFQKKVRRGKKKRALLQSDVPADVIVHICCTFLSNRDVVSLGSTCSKLNNVIKEKSRYIFKTQRDVLGICSAVTLKGNPCRNYRLIGSVYCQKHERVQFIIHSVWNWKLVDSQWYGLVEWKGHCDFTWEKFKEVNGEWQVSN